MADKKDAKKTTKSEKPELKASTIGFTKENNPNNLIQRTLIVFKPDAVQRGIVGEILSRFERVGLKIVGAKMVSPDKDHYYQHYEGISKMITRRGQKTFDETLKFMTSGPVIAMVLEGVENIRDIVAFPKNGSGVDLMMNSPSPVDQIQLDEAHLVIIPEED